MKVYFCRDNDGDCSTWRYKREKPVYDGDMWGTDCCGKELITDGNEVTFEKYGKGFHGVRKGCMKLIDLENKRWGTVYSWKKHK